MKEIEVLIKAEKFKTTTYNNPWNCALASTLTEMGYKHNGVASDVVINDIMYEVPDNEIHEVYLDWIHNEIEPIDLLVVLKPVE